MEDAIKIAIAVAPMARKKEKRETDMLDLQIRPNQQRFPRRSPKKPLPPNTIRKRTAPAITMSGKISVSCKSLKTRELEKRVSHDGPDQVKIAGV
jgi:hypothetical protein